MQKNARRRQISMSAQHRCLSPTAPADSAPRDAVVADRNRGRSILQTEDCRTSLQTEIFPENRGQISHFLTPVKLGKWLAKCFRVILWRHLGPNHWDAFDGGEGGGRRCIISELWPWMVKNSEDKYDVRATNVGTRPALIMTTVTVIRNIIIQNVA